MSVDVEITGDVTSSLLCLLPALATDCTADHKLDVKIRGRLLCKKQNIKFLWHANWEPHRSHPIIDT